MTGRVFFITGTAPSVGKTTVATALAAALVEAGCPVQAIKPVASGDPPPGRDAIRLAHAAQHPPSSHACFELPASPRRAAQLTGQPLTDQGLRDWVHAQRLPGHTVLVEGAGGWRLPLTDTWEVQDLARSLAGPVLVVAANRTGVLNHAALTVDAVRSAGLPVLGVVLNDAFDSPPELAAWNRDDLRRLLPDVPVVPLRRLRLPADLVPAGTWLARRFGLLD